MKLLFNLSSALLGLSGILHLIKVFAYPIDPNSLLAVILTAIFGLAYLVIGYFLFRRHEPLLWPAVIVPLVGLILTLVGMKPNPDFFVVSFIVLDLLVILIGGYILLRGKAPIGRVS